MNKPTRQLLVIADKTFRITVPADAKITFGPWSPPKGQNYDVARNIEMGGTLRIYDEKNVIAVFSKVVSYRDVALPYAEQVAKEEGATIWKDDETGYVREHKVSSRNEWIEPKLVTNGKRAKAAKPF